MPSKFREMLKRQVDEAELRMIDVRDPESVQVELSSEGQRLWVHVNGMTVLRIQWSGEPTLEMLGWATCLHCDKQVPKSHFDKSSGLCKEKIKQAEGG